MPSRLTNLALAAGAALAAGGRGDMEISLVNFDNMQYTMPIKIGTPWMSQTVLPDSGSVDLVVLGKKIPQHGNRAYIASKSSTSNIPNPKNVYEIVYGSATAYGHLGSDQVKVQGATVSEPISMLIELGDKYSLQPGGMYWASAFEGIAGLGIVPDPPSDKKNTARYDLLSLLGFQAFLFKLGASTPGTLVLNKNGGTMPSHTYHGLVANGYWAIPMKGACYGTASCQYSHPGSVLIDSGTSLIYLPKAVR